MTALLEQYTSRTYRADARPRQESYSIKDRVAIVGIGETEFSRQSVRSELMMACEAIKKAADDAGLKLSEIDGLVKYSTDRVDMPNLVASLGIPNLNFFAETGYGGNGTCSTVHVAAIAVASGLAKNVVVFRSLNEASGTRFGRVPGEYIGLTTPDTHWGYYFPFGFLTPPTWVAPFAQRYMHEFGATSEQFGWISVVCRENAQNNPRAIMYGKPITIQDHQESRIVADPLHLFDCALDTDGAAALILTTAERARDLKQIPAYILATAQGLCGQGELMTSFYRPDMTGMPECWYMGQELFRLAGVTPKDMDVAQIYDAFTPHVIQQLEALGFCGEGEAAAFVEGGDRIRVGGELPLNTSGGHLADGYIHGMSLNVEAVRQIRGTSVNQVKDAELSLVSAGFGGVILRR